MKKLYLSAGIVIVAIIAALIFLGNAQNQSARPNDLPDTDNMPTDEGRFTGSIQDLFSRGKDIMCSYTHTDDKSTTNGTIYIAGEKLYGDIATSYGDTTQHANIIRSDQTIYIWDPTTQKGFQMTTNDTSGSGNTQIFQNKLDFNCIPWNRDEQKFVPPSSVTFTDPTTYSQEIQAQATPSEDANESAN